MRMRAGYRATAILTALAAGAAPVAGWAQPAPADPPARVGRLARVSGTVSYHLAGADRWEPAVLNLPVSTGAAFWTEPGGRADIGITGDRVVLDQSTELDMTRLDDHAEAAALPKGSVYWHERSLPAGNSASVQTPRGTVTFAKAGRYEVVAGDAQRPTTVTVVEGEADMGGIGVAVHVGPNQMATITGDGGAVPFQATIGPAARDPFLTAMLAEERPAKQPVAAPPAYVAEMTGGDALDEYGDWATTPEYGAIWYPPADPGFVPYRHGHWAFVQPWGWTWVDEAPWGFAPSHYGRWVQVSDRWGWIPGLAGAPVAPGYPVYAPAVVSFLGGAALGALAAGSVGWVPLGPREPYFPPYRVSTNYVRQVNITNVANVNTVVNTYGQHGGPGAPMINRDGASLVPAGAMAGSQNLAGLARPVPPGANPRIARLQGAPPLRPTLATAGVTPPVARQLSLGNQGPGRPQAPGPAIRTYAARPNLAPAAVVGSAALGAAAAGAAARPEMPLRDMGPSDRGIARPGAPEVPRVQQQAPVARPAAEPESRPQARPQLVPHPAIPAAPARPAMRPAPPPAPRPQAAPPRPVQQHAAPARPAPPPRPAPAPRPPPPHLAGHEPERR